MNEAAKNILNSENIRGWIFDFNGTLLFDSPAHSDAWKDFLLEKGFPITDEEMRRDVQGRPNPVILRHFFGELTDEQIAAYSAEKENAYRNVCLKPNDWFKLAPGVPEMFDLLRQKGIPFTIATSSQWDNVSFYFEHLGLSRWFTPETIIFDNGTLPGKPAPDIYLRAMDLLGLAPDQCAVFEDSLSGIRSGLSAGAGAVIAVASDWSEEELLKVDGVKAVIDDFSWAADFLLHR